MDTRSRWTSVTWIAFVVLLALAGWSAGAWAGTTGKIAGKVVDADTREPLLSTNIVVVGTTLGATTNVKGEYFILNIPAGVYDVRFTMLGYKEVVVRKVLVQTDLTSTVDVKMTPTVLELGEVVVVVAERPLIEMDLPASRQTTTAENLSAMPIDNLNDVLSLVAGAVEENGNLHIRGGRDREVAYIVDGAVVADPLTGSFDTNIPEMALEEISIQTGGLSAEYGSAQSGVVNMVLKEGGPRTTGALRLKTSDFSGNRTDPWHEQLWNIQGSLGGPVPYVNNLRYFLSTEYESTEGVYPHDDKAPLTVNGKLSYNLTPTIKLTTNGLFYSNDYHEFDRGSYNYNEWKRTTFEDLNSGYTSAENPALVDAGGHPWYGNGQLDDEWEDLNGNGTYEEWVDYNNDGIMESEFNDLNGNGVLDTEDLDHNGSLDSFYMLDHTPNFKARANLFGVTLSQTLSDKTFYEVRASLYRTYLKFNIVENTNEDQDGDGRFDMGELTYQQDGATALWNDVNGDGMMQTTEDLNGNGQFDFELDSNHDGVPDLGYDVGLDGLPFTGDFGEDDGIATTEDLDGDGNLNGLPEGSEDLNGNNVWDLRVFGPDHDLFTDEDHDGYVDASENNPDSAWIPMSELPMFGVGEKDDDDFFTYGYGNTYHRDRWHEDEKFVYNLAFQMTSQVNPSHQMKFGLEGTYYDIFNYDVDAASGGNIYGENYRVFPYAFATFAQDKMEFKGLIVNAGLRFDYFSANYHNYPTDITDPVTDPTIGGTIKNPTSVPAKFAWSPRLGVSHPITDKDMLYFNYGRYFQVPRFDFMFENVTFLLTGAFPRMGNANLEPEQTTSYELGVQHLFGEDLVLSLTGFYKDITGLTDTRQIFYTSSSWYGIYDNTDYGNVRGFEVTLLRARRPYNYFSGTLTYTYSFARGKNSSPTADYVTIWANNNVPTTETFLDWDQRHTISANLDIRTQDKQRYFGLRYTENLGFNFIVQYGSGRPWSPPSRDKDTWKYTNTERMPYTLNVDMVADKIFRWKGLTTRVFLEVRNLFNRLNLENIADTQWYAQQVDAAGNLLWDADGPLDDPTVYSVPRVVRLGVGVQF